jgi:2-polyprenyl-6-hydroxyphenyl methylase/3-demethylubiquinone-9 3-methyltransferase
MSSSKNPSAQSVEPPLWDHSSYEEFFAYYARKSEDPREVERCRKIRDTLLRCLPGSPTPPATSVLDVGCAGGTLSMVWAELGFSVHGLDVNEPLIEFARRRAAAAGMNINFRLGSAVELPWSDRSMDICLSLELLEHVPDWQKCLKEFARVLRPGGALFLATSNRLCPVQYEFNLPAYSWYPAVLKGYLFRQATTTRPHLANYAKYPAVNWFTPYTLAGALRKVGFRTLDRFDMIDRSRLGLFGKAALAAIKALPTLRWLGHVCTPGTTMLAIRE